MYFKSTYVKFMTGLALFWAIFLQEAFAAITLDIPADLKSAPDTITSNVSSWMTTSLVPMMLTIGVVMAMVFLVYRVFMRFVSSV